MQKDVIIVGQGLAGTVLALTLKTYGYSYVLIDKEEEHTSSNVAAGIFNPFTGRKITKTWKAGALFPFAKKFYSEIAGAYGIDCMHEILVYRAFSDVMQYNDFMGKSADAGFSYFIDTIHTAPFRSNYLKNEFGGVRQKNGGWIDVKKLVSEARKLFKAEDSFINDTLSTDELDVSSSQIEWKGVTSDKIVFAGGYHNNEGGFFDWLPFVPTKGEMLLVAIPGLPQDMIYNKGFFLLPQGEGLFLVGATFSKDIEEGVSENGIKQLKDKLFSFLNAPYTIIDQVWGVRPTVKDRRPLVGWHPVYNNIGIFNGLGTKGVTLAPYFSDEWVSSWESKQNISDEINIERYYSLYRS